MGRLTSNNQLMFMYARRYPLRVVLTIILGFSSALFNGVGTTLIVPVILNFLGQDVNLKGAPPIIQFLLNPFARLPDQYQLPLMMAVILLTLILKNIATYASAIVSSSLGRTLTTDMREAGLRMLLEVDLDYHVKTKVGELINLLGGEVSRAANAISIVIRTLITAITILVFTAILLSISWQLTIAASFMLALVVFLNQALVQRSKASGQILSQMSATYSVATLETFSGIRLVKSSATEETEYQNISRLIRNREQADLDAQLVSAAVGPVSEIASMVTVLLIVFLGRIFFFDSIQSLSAVLLTYLLVLFRMLPFVSQLNGFRAALSNTSASITGTKEFLNRERKPFMVNGKLPFVALKESIHFNQLTFSYPGRDEIALQDVNLHLPKGTTLALVGSSGAGKSTLADLLPRFYDPTAGNILIDGQDIRDFDIKTLRRAMGIVSQETFLFNDSIRNNIAYGQEQATDEDILEAVKRANALEFIEKMPKGLDTLIGDRGVLLSGGQRQRLAIARALLQNPEILILDEATSALDTVSERLVQSAIDELSRDRTTLVIAHRLSTIQKADQIAVLDKGRVVEVGTHEELLQWNGYYARLYEMQFSQQRNADGLLPMQEMQLKASYKARANLNILLGSLGLLSDGLVDDAEEQLQVVNESYRAAVQLLETLEFFEKGWIQPSISQGHPQ